MPEEFTEYGFGTWDYLVFSFTLAISAGIGVYYRFSGGRQKTTEEYLLADKNMSILPVAFSLMASFMSSITLLGVSSENYMFGTQFVVINFSYIIGTPLAAYGFLPVFFRLQATSAYQYLELRFGRRTRLCASMAFVLQMVLYMGIVLFAPALALSAVTGLNKTGSILAVGLVCTFYSTIGGMKAILITDVFQSLLMFASVLCVGIKGAMDVGGVGQVFEMAKQGGRLEFFNMTADPTVRATFWTQVIGGFFTFTSLYAVNQAQVQRLLTLKSLRRSQTSLWVSWPILTFLSLSTSFAGLAIYSRYANCDPLLEKRITSPDQLLPLFVVDALNEYPGVAGLFVAGIFSGTLSTVSSALNSLAAVTVEDFLRPIWLKNFTDFRVAWISQLLALFFGILCIALAFLAESLGGVLQASLTIFGVVGGPLLALFTLGMFSSAVEEKGALAGLFTGLIFSLWIGFGGPKPPIPSLPRTVDGCIDGNSTVTESVLLAAINNFNSTYNHNSESLSTVPMEEPYFFPLYKLSYMWYAPLGFCITVLVAQLVSRMVRFRRRNMRSKVTMDERLFSPWMPKIFRQDVINPENDVVLVGRKREEKEFVDLSL